MLRSVQLLFPLVASLFAISGLAQQPAPIARHWQVHSFFYDAELAEKSVTHADVAADGSVWFAVSDGLYHYDGYRWKRYTTADGLPSNYVRCVLVADDGTLWVGTDRGAGRFDGETFDDSMLQGRLAGPSIRRIVEDTDGSLWFCCDQWPKGDVTAGLTRMKDGQFTTWRQADGLPSSYTSDYVRVSSGQQFVLTNQGLAEFTDDGFRQPLKDAGLWEEDTYVWSLVESARHGLIVATDTHFFQFKDGSWRRIPNQIAGLEQAKLVATRDGEVFTCTPGRGPVIYRWVGEGWTEASRQLTDITGGNNYLFEDKQGAVWIAGSERLLRWERIEPEWQLHQNVSGPVHRDSEGGIWFKKSQGGLVRWASGQPTHYPDLTAPIAEGPDGVLWVASDEKLYRWNNDRLDWVDLAGHVKPKLLGIDGRGVVWVSATDADRRRFLIGVDGDRLHVKDISDFEDRVRVRRSDADPRAGIWAILGANNFPPFHLVYCDTESIQTIPLPKRAQISHPPSVTALADGSVFVSGFFGLMRTTDLGATWSEVPMPSSAVGKLRVLGGEAWVQCRGDLGGRAALARYRDGEWDMMFDRQGKIVGQNGRKQLFASSQGKIEVLTAGVQRLPPPIATSPFDTRVTRVVAGDSGGLWVAVGTRCYRYRPDTHPPETEVIHGDQTLSEGETLHLRVRGLERFTPQRLKRYFRVSTQVDGQDWTPFETLGEEITFDAMPLGEHHVQIRVEDAAGQIDPTPATFRFSVLPVPLQSKVWFKPVVAIGFASILALALLAFFNWARVGRMARGLEREVARKTNRVVSSEREFRLLFEDSQDAICLFADDGTLQSCNDVGKELLAQTGPSTAHLRTLFVDQDEADRFESELRKTNHLRGSRFKMQTLDGKPFDAILSVNTRTDAGGNQIGHQVIIRDISTLVDLQQQLSETKKMEAVGRMAGGIAHDFNNFLAVVMYGAEFVRLSAKGDPAVDQGVQMILDAAERGRHLTGQIQTFSRASTNKMDIVQTGKVLEGLEPLLQGVVDASVAVKYHVAEDLDNIRGDESQLEQIFVNLAINASHAMPEGGTLSIHASNVDVTDHPVPELRLDAPGPHVVLEVADTGHGMDAATCERIFDPFFTTKPHGQGTGLGLAIVYGIVQQFRGQISVDSQVGRGTRFKIFLPATKEQGDEPGPQTPGQEPSKGNETILLVEDEQAIRDLACNSLRHYGYHVVAAVDGLDAKRKIESDGEFDLVISDVLMPGMTGTALLKWIRKTRPDLPIMLITGHADAGSEHAMDELDVPCLKKPFLPATLASRVRELLDRRLAATTP
ncbi:Blue-light-activated protein [Stieleria neptunia]|uniref:histidine kinase n=1 Tax=Stieleria neptunia TaxID=2527979 RepID=A0A518HVR1_9BACT|nr:ATP-binding protein [Stieleria neptunia]QDV44897.1 Blue-light-activated protein [Stieleria neptunia]